MIRTKHLFVVGALLVTVMSTGGIGLMVQRMFGSLPAQSAAIILGTPDDQYAAIVEDGSAADVASFVERIRNSYVPPVTVVEDATEVTPENPDTEYVPLPEPETPMPEPLPVATIEEEIVIETNGTTTEQITRSTTAQAEEGGDAVE